MTGDETVPSDRGGFDLAPPPSFGVSERSDGHLLPVAMDMGEILSAEGESEVETQAEAAAETQAETAIQTHAARQSGASVPVAATSGVPVAAARRSGSHPVVSIRGAQPSMFPEIGSDADLDDDPHVPRGGFALRLGAVALLVASCGGVYLWLTGAPQQPAVEGTARAGAAPQQTAHASSSLAAATNTTPLPSPTDTDDPAEVALARANDVGQMRASTLPERHQLLGELEREGKTSRVNLDLHIALDLMQAHQATAPCETFSDALTLIESSRDRTPFLPAIASVNAAPEAVGTELAQDCAGLQDRLVALKAAVATDASAPTPAPREPSDAPLAAASDEDPDEGSSRANTKARKTRKRKHGDSAPTAAASPPPATEPAPPTPAAATPPPPETPDSPPTNTTKRASVSSKLDDGVRDLD